MRRPLCVPGKRVNVVTCGTLANRVGKVGRESSTKDILRYTGPLSFSLALERAQGGHLGQVTSPRPFPSRKTQTSFMFFPRGAPRAEQQVLCTAGLQQDEAELTSTGPSLCPHSPNDSDVPRGRGVTRVVLAPC